MSTKTVAATVAETDILAQAYERLEQAEEVLDALETEQRDNVAAMTEASKARDSAGFFALQKRQNEMAAELHFAKVMVAQARIEVEEQRLKKAQQELPPLLERMADLRAEIAPLEAQLAAVGYQASQRENIARNHARTKAPLVQQLERLENEWRQRSALENAPVVRNLQGFYR